MALLLSNGKYVMIKTVAANRIDYYTFDSQAARTAAGTDLAQYPKVEWVLTPVNFNVATTDKSTVANSMLEAGYNALKIATTKIHTYTESPIFVNFTDKPGE